MFIHPIFEKIFHHIMKTILILKFNSTSTQGRGNSPNPFNLLRYMKSHTYVFNLCKSMMYHNSFPRKTTQKPISKGEGVGKKRLNTCAGSTHPPPVGTLAFTKNADWTHMN